MNYGSERAAGNSPEEEEESLRRNSGEKRRGIRPCFHVHVAVLRDRVAAAFCTVRSCAKRFVQVESTGDDNPESGNRADVLMFQLNTEIAN